MLNAVLLLKQQKTSKKEGLVQSFLSDCNFLSFFSLFLWSNLTFCANFFSLLSLSFDSHFIISHLKVQTRLLQAKKKKKLLEKRKTFSKHCNWNVDTLTLFSYFSCESRSQDQQIWRNNGKTGQKDENMAINPFASQLHAMFRFPDHHCFLCLESLGDGWAAGGRSAEGRRDFLLLSFAEIQIFWLNLFSFLSPFDGWLKVLTFLLLSVNNSCCCCFQVLQTWNLVFEFPSYRLVWGKYYVFPKSDRMNRWEWRARSLVSYLFSRGYTQLCIPLNSQVQISGTWEKEKETRRDQECLCRCFQNVTRQGEEDEGGREWGKKV